MSGAMLSIMVVRYSIGWRGSVARGRVVRVVSMGGGGRRELELELGFWGGCGID